MFDRKEKGRESRNVGRLRVALCECGDIEDCRDSSDGGRVFVWSESMSRWME